MLKVLGWWKALSMVLLVAAMCAGCRAATGIAVPAPANDAALAAIRNTKSARGDNPLSDGLFVIRRHD